MNNEKIQMEDDENNRKPIPILLLRLLRLRLQQLLLSASKAYSTVVDGTPHMSSAMSIVAQFSRPLEPTEADDAARVQLVTSREPLGNPNGEL